ncbi:hypothetical protein BDZ97DRAFT_2063223 [Flammula alnicola]|nr:hypothetical protein BDZ97DRAFT_2063223 [Flammula alnicola]
MHALTAFLALFFIQPCVIAATVLESRQGPNQDFDPNRPPDGWVDVGCFSDTVGSPSKGFSTRTLRAQSLSSNEMTPKMCIDFCSDSTQFPPNGYKFAGMEDGTECCTFSHSSSAYRNKTNGGKLLTGNLTSDQECSLGCPGEVINGLELFNCGGPNFLRIYTNSTSSPLIPTTAIPDGVFRDSQISPTWQYVGCYSDSPTNRTLQTKPVAIGFTDIFSCVELCQQEADIAIFDTLTANTFFAGIENGGDCWCGPSVAKTSQRLPDIVCESLGCQLTNSLACGGVNAMVLYQFLEIGTDVNCNVPVARGTNPFFLDAVFLDNPSERVHLSTVGLVHRTFDSPDIGPQASILSECDGSSNCPNPMVFHLNQIFLVPNLTLGSLLNDGPIFVPPIRSPHFIELQDSILTFGFYCLQSSLVSSGQIALTIDTSRPLPFNAPPNAIVNPARPWALCANGTAFGRLDVVYKELIFVPGFNLTNCRDVELLMTFVEPE